jgi:hypothetical protein
MRFENLMTVNVRILHLFLFDVFEIDNIFTGHLWSYVHYINLSFILFHKGNLVEFNWDELLNVALLSVAILLALAVSSYRY